MHPQDDVTAIRALLRRQFASLNWTATNQADWNGFAGDFLPGAPLYPAARPVQAQSAEAFVERMKGLATSQLQSFEETLLGSEVLVFGNVAVAVAGCEMVENGSERSRSVEMLLLVKDGGAWRIAAQAWDRADVSRPIPDRLLHSPAERTATS